MFHNVNVSDIMQVDGNLQVIIQRPLPMLKIVIMLQNMMMKKVIMSAACVITQCRPGQSKMVVTIGKIVMVQKFQQVIG